MQDRFDTDRDWYEFYSVLLVSMSQDYIADKGGGNSLIQHFSEKDDQKIVLNFHKLDRRGEEIYPRIVVQLFFRITDIQHSEEFEEEDHEEHDNSVPYIDIYKVNFDGWNRVNFPLFDDYVLYNPRASFKKWIKYMISYKSDNKAMEKFERFLRHSKKKEKKKAIESLLGRQFPFRSGMNNYLQRSRDLISELSDENKALRIHQQRRRSCATPEGYTW